MADSTILLSCPRLPSLQALPGHVAVADELQEYCLVVLLELVSQAFELEGSAYFIHHFHGAGKHVECFF